MECGYIFGSISAAGILKISWHNAASSSAYESIRLWCIKFGWNYTGRLNRRPKGYGDTFYIDEVFVKINGKQHYDHPRGIYAKQI